MELVKMNCLAEVEGGSELPRTTAPRESSSLPGSSSSFGSTSSTVCFDLTQSLVYANHFIPKVYVKKQLFNITATEAAISAGASKSLTNKNLRGKTGKRSMAIKPRHVLSIHKALCMLKSNLRGPAFTSDWSGDLVPAGNNG